MKSPSRRSPLRLPAIALLTSCAGTGEVQLPDETPDVVLDTSPAIVETPPQLCDLRSDLAEPMFTEGDTVTFTVSCTGDLSTDSAQIDLVSDLSGALWDSSTRQLNWPTGPSDGGRWDIVFQITSVQAAGFLQTATVTFWVADNPADPRNVPVTAESYVEEWGLPVLHISHTDDLSESYSAATTVFLGDTYPAEIKIRGASSASYPKNSYTLDFDVEELPIEAWGVTREHLVLITSFDDNSYVRQKLIYDQWAAIADFWDTPRLTPRTFFVVVYLNGSYHGLYTAIDRIDDEFIGQQEMQRGGGLYKAISHDANYDLTNSSGRTKSTLHDGFLKKAGVPEGDFAELDALMAFTGSATDASLIADADGWISLEEFMDWQLMVVYSSSGDSAGKNAYLYSDPSGSGFRYVPWDFNHAWGQSWYTTRTSPSDTNTYASKNRVFRAIEAEQQAVLWDRFLQMRAPGGPFSPQWLTGQLDAYFELIGPSAQRDWDRWSEAYNSYARWQGPRNDADDWTNYQGEKAYLYQWLADRSAVYDELDGG